MTTEQLLEAFGEALANGWWLNAQMMLNELRTRLSEAQYGL